MRIHFCKIQLFFILSSSYTGFCIFKRCRTLYTEFKISHNYITRVGLKSAQITLHMNGCFHSTRLISGGSQLHMKVINGVSFLKSTLRRPEWMTTPDKVKQTPWPIRLNPQSYWNSQYAHMCYTHTHTPGLVCAEPPCAVSCNWPYFFLLSINCFSADSDHRSCVSLFTFAGALQIVCVE